MPINNIDSPQGINTEPSLKKLYSDREYYYNSILNYVSLFNDNVYFNDLYNESFLYGIVDDELDVILPKTEFLVSTESGNKEKQQLLDFTADALNGLKNYLKSGVTVGKMSNNGPYSNIKVFKSYVNNEVLLDSEISVMADEFKSLMLSKIHLNYKIRDHETFNKEYILFLKDMIIKKDIAITKSTLAINNIFLAFNNGLTFDIALNNKCDDDREKYEKFLNHPDFLPFKDACKRFGFLIDKNVPWRLTLDILSPAMRDVDSNKHRGYLQKRDIGDIKDLFKKRYNKVYLSDLEHLKRYFYLSYAYYMKKNKFYEKDYSLLAGNSAKNRKLFTRDVLSETEYLAKFDDSYWLRLYVYFKNYENITGLTQQKFENIVRESNNFLFEWMRFSFSNSCRLRVLKRLTGSP